VLVLARVSLFRSPARTPNVDGDDVPDGLVVERARADEAGRRLDARLRQAEKVESLGRMAAAIAHHFNNKLTAVMGSLELALDDLAAGRDVRSRSPTRRRPRARRPLSAS